MARELAARQYRVHDRRAMRLVVSVAHAEGWRTDARVVDVGLGGACLELAEEPKPGDRVIVGFLAPALWDPLDIRARVVWVRPQGPLARPTSVRCGLAFEHADPSNVMALFELLTSLGFDGGSER